MKLARRLGPVIGLFLLVALTYGASVGSGFVYDDMIVITKERVATTPGDFLRVFAERHYPSLPYYRPVTRLTFLIQKTLQGSANAAPYHLFNALLMGLTASLALALLRLPAFGLPRFVAWIGAALFALHPLASSSVYPAASGRETLLPTCLSILVLYSFLRGTRAGYWISAGAFALALFSKEQTVVLLPMLVLADALGLFAAGRPSALRGWATRYAPFVLMQSAYFLVRWRLFRGEESALNPDHALTLLTPIHALQTILAPFRALRYEPVEWATWFSWPRMAWVVACALVLVSLTLRRWSAVSRSTAFWLGVFLLAMLPTANIVRQDAPFSERYVLLSLLGFVGILSGVAAAYSSSPAARRAVRIGGVVLAVLCTVATLHRAAYFSSNVAFCEQWAKTSPDYHLAHYNLGRAYEDVQNWERAGRSYATAIRLNPAWPSSQMNMGALLVRHGRYRESLPYFRRVLELDPASATAHYHLGLALMQLERLDEAVTQYTEALALDPTLAEAHNNLGVIFVEQGDLPRAVEHYRQALAIDPGKTNTRENLEKLTGPRG